MSIYLTVTIRLWGVLALMPMITATYKLAHKMLCFYPDSEDHLGEKFIWRGYCHADPGEI